MVLIAGTLGGLLLLTLIIAANFRKVVPTNEVHIVQYKTTTVSYGKDKADGNTYYEWPAWLPYLGVTKVVLPVSVFDIDIKDYEAYDKGRLPFVVDILAFFRIVDSNTAAQRVESFSELKEQLLGIVKGAARTILASHELEDIMEGRSKFGEAFTKEVKEQLPHWGVEAVKNIELMDIRDSNGSQVIQNIMKKKKSLIEMESRTEVAKNHRAAQLAEIDAQRDVEVNEQDAKKAVGLRTVATKKEVAISDQKAEQEVKEQERETKEREMAVIRVQKTRDAEIHREAAVTRADQEKQEAVLRADGNLQATKLSAEGIEATGRAKAEAEKQMQLAPVKAQIALAQEIGSNDSYQKYLVSVRKIESDQAVGIEQAKALTKANVKVITNAGTPPEGVKSVMDLFSSKGGTEVGAMLEGLSHTPTGKRVLEAAGLKNKKDDTERS